MEQHEAEECSENRSRGGGNRVGACDRGVGTAGSDVAVLQSCIATMTAGVLACLSGAIGALATIREDRLFAYFKNR